MSADNNANQYIAKDRSSLTDEVSFKDILLGIINWFKYLLSKWKIILAITIVLAVIFFIRANNKPLQYIAASTFVLQEGGGGGAPALSGGFASILGIDNGVEGGGIFQGDNLLELYRSRFMIKKALLSKIPDSAGYIIDRYIKINGLRQAWSENPELRDIDFFKKGNKRYTRLQDSLMTKFVEDIRNNYLGVDRVGRLSIFRVEVRSTNEDFAKLFNDQIVKTVNEFYVQTKTLKSTENLKLLQRQVDSIGGALNGAMYRVASSTDVTINANPARQVTRIPSQRSQVEVENNRAMLNELVRNLELSKMSLRKETPLIQIIDGPVFPLEKRRESRAKAIITGAVMGGVLGAVFFSLLLLYKKILQ